MTQEEEEAQGLDNGRDQFRILVVQQGDSGRPKIEGIQEHGDGRFSLSTWSVPRDLPRILDETEAYLPDNPQADLVLDFVNHPDVSQELIQMCKDKGIPVVAPGKKAGLKWAHTPPV